MYLPQTVQRLELKIPPVVVFLVTGLGMWLAGGSLPHAHVDLPFARVMAGLLVAAGLIIAVAGVLAFRRHETTVLPHAPDKASAVVSDSVFQYTRNPMYLGLALVLAAWAVKLGNALSFAGIPLFVAYMTRFQIQPEERALLAKFGAPFGEYMQSVRRWL